jgi:hypothetical protein
MANRNGGFIGPDGLDAPDPPTAVTNTRGNASGEVSVGFTAPTDAGTSAITGFVVQVASSGNNYSGGSNTGTSSPIVVSSLSNGTSYTAKVWAINAYGTSAPSDASGSATPAVPVIALKFGGDTSSGNSNVIDKVDITTLGDGVDYGDINIASSRNAAVGSSTRAVLAVAFGADPKDAISYKEFSSSGNMVDFGNLTVERINASAASNGTRGIFFGGDPTLVMDYITIASAGNATDFGDMDGSGESKTTSACASPTRAVFFGGDQGSGPSNVIGYVTIGTTGNQNDFGDLLGVSADGAAFGSSTRGVYCGGSSASANSQNVIQYITISSTGNASDFGDLQAPRKFHSGASSNTRGLSMSGERTGSQGTRTDEIDYVTIASTGDAADFGNLTIKESIGRGACSNAHGGLQ